MMVVVALTLFLGILAAIVGTTMAGSTVVYAAALMLAVVLAAVVALALEAIDVPYDPPDDRTP